METPWPLLLKVRCKFLLAAVKTPGAVLVSRVCSEIQLGNGNSIIRFILSIL